MACMFSMPLQFTSHAPIMKKICMQNCTTISVIYWRNVKLTICYNITRLWFTSKLGEGMLWGGRIILSENGLWTEESLLQNVRAVLQVCILLQELRLFIQKVCALSQSVSTLRKTASLPRILRALLQKNCVH